MGIKERLSFLSQLSAGRRGVSRWGGLALLAAGALSLVALLSYHGSDPQWFFKSQDTQATQSVRNWFGPLGATIGEAWLQTLGAASLLATGLLIAFGWQRLRHWQLPALRPALLGLTLILALSCLLQLGFGPLAPRGSPPIAAGGFVGAALAGFLLATVSGLGAWLACSLALAGAMILLARPSFARSATLLGSAGRDGASRVRTRFDDWRSARAAGPVKRVTRSAAAVAADAAASRAGEAQAKSAPPKIRVSSSSTSATAGGGQTKTSTRREIKPPPPEPPRQSALPMERGEREYAIPPLDLMNPPEPQGIESEQELLARAQMITEKLREFSVGGAVVAVHPGPVVTTFEFKPDPGVKYSKITSMTDDLSLALKAESVRIDRMPGRSTVGIEVPNRKQEVIYPRELMGSDRFRASRSKLPLALGKDITGEVFVAELDRMPHLLIAGATGAGKSVGLNGMIVSLLYRSTPHDLRFIMIDTKMIELGVYADIPHLLIPVVTDPKHANIALKWAVREMENRYRKLAAIGVRNLAQFNEAVAKDSALTMTHHRTGETVPLTHMPYIVIVIDEMADLMMVTSAEVEESIMRLAQMARAVGIHLILATQRPSVDVITGTIKANFPSRVAFRVSQRVDSRTIIDQQGAEHLLGRGDMLFLATGASRLVRLHGGYITESEIQRIATYLKKLAEPTYDQTILSDGEEGPGGTGESAERDEMYTRAVRTVIQEGRCSVTLIQRRLQLGYARAARIVDMMEQEGVVGPGEGSKPREILAGPEVLENLEAQHG